MVTTISRHLASPEFSPDEYLRQRQIALALELEAKTAVYLDLKFWIALRAALTPATTTPQHVEFLELLRGLVHAGDIFCPISDSTLAEVLKQEAPQTRSLTALLIDELSFGVSLITSEIRFNTELARFIHAKGKGDDDMLHPLDHLVWTKLSFSFGYVHPSDTRFDPATECALQKAFIDHLWDMPLAEIIKTATFDLPVAVADRFAVLAQSLNAGSAEHAHELKSFQQAYAAELSGIVDVVGDTAIEIVNDMAMKAGISPDGGGDADRRRYVNQWKNLLFATLRNGKARSALRTMHIRSCLHAAVRWDKSRKYDKNDFFDFDHACAALAYCDVFLTERPLKVLITANHVALDQLYGCRVIADLPEAIAYLRSLS